MDSLTEAERQLTNLATDRERIQRALSQAVEDADADAMIRHRRALDDNDVRQYAARARIMRLRKSEDERARQDAMAEREALEVALAEATRQYADAVSVADERRVQMQTIQARLFGLDSFIETHRQSINEGTATLRQYVSRWHTDAIKAASDDAACI